MGEGKFTGEVVSASPGRTCTPQAEQESILLGHWGDLDGGSGLVVLACVLKVTAKKDSQLFRGRKVHRQRKSWLCL